MISGASMVLQTGSGTVELPIDQIERIVPVTEVADMSPVPMVKPEIVNVLVRTQAASSSEEVLIKAAIEQGLEPGFVESVARVESGLSQKVVSSKGALGLMQLMPGTASELGVNPLLAAENAQGGAKFLRQLLLRYNGDTALALAAYNAGPGAVDRFKGVPPYLETRKYVIKVLQEYARQQRLQSEKVLQAEKAKVAAGDVVAAK